MATKTRKPKVEALTVWMHNNINDEKRIPDAELVAGFAACRANCLNSMRPLNQQIAMHLSWCVEATWDQDDFAPFVERNWEAFLDAMELRNADA